MTDTSAAAVGANEPSPPTEPPESMTRKQWENVRKLTVGASGAPTVLGLNPHKTVLHEWGEMTSKLPGAVPSEAMLLGHVMEPLLVDAYADRTGRCTNNPGSTAIQRNPEYPWLHATLDRKVIAWPTCGNWQPDGMIPFPADGNGVLECKLVGMRSVHAWKDGVPDYVMAQVQQQLLVTGYAWGSVVAMLGGSEIEWWDILRDDEWIRGTLIPQTKRFYALVQKGEPPEPTDADSDTLAALYPQHEPGKVVDLDELTTDAMILMYFKRQAEGAAKEIATRENRIKAVMGDAEIGRLPDGTEFTWRTQVSTYKAKPAEVRHSRRFGRVKKRK